jgi:hypothetical protein
MELEGRLVPILREGVEVVKMVFYKRLQAYLAGKYADRSRQDINQLAGAIINDLFATPNPEEPFASFLQQNRDCIAAEMSSLAASFPELRAPLSDALRVQFLCDAREGLDSTALLTRARQLGILVMEREVPLPKHFLEMVRSWGNAFHFLKSRGPAGEPVTIH